MRTPAPLRRLILLLLPLLLIALRIEAQQRAHVPPRGSAERRAVMDGLRPTIERELKQPVIFEVRTMRVLGAWAFVEALPRRPDGSAVSYRGTPFQEAIELGVFDEGIFALLRRGPGGWRVVRYAIGPTDVAWDGWDREVGAPRGVFPYP